MLQFEENREVAEIGVRLIDDAYTSWFVAARDCERAMNAWNEDHPGGYWAYRAALDREEAAARDLHRLSELARRCVDALDGLGAVRQPAPAVPRAGGPRLLRRSTRR
jgi:hypothetical protein